VSSTRAVRAAWLAWGIVLAVMAAMVVSGSDRTVTPHYWQAGARWLAAQPLYAATGHGFIYPPHAAIAFAPFAIVPLPIADLLWRLLTIGAYAHGVRRLARLGAHASPAELFPLATAIGIPVAADGARNGQATLLVTGMMVFAVVALANRQWTRAAAWLAVSIALKPLGAMLLVMAAVLYPPMRLRLLAAMALVAIAPFAAQHPAYVLDQYRAWAHMVTIGSSVGADQDWAQVFSVLSVLRLQVTAGWQALIRAAAFLLTVVTCIKVRRKYPAAEAAFLLFVVHACFVMLFSPRTENNTYAVLAPAIAVLGARAWLVERHRLAGAWLASLAGGITVSYELGRRILPGRPATWLAPLMAICLSVFVGRRIWTSRE
jgi:alpha-1,2-mannosyltransferase